MTSRAQRYNRQRATISAATQLPTPRNTFRVSMTVVIDESEPREVAQRISDALAAKRIDAFTINAQQVKK